MFFGVKTTCLYVAILFFACGCVVSTTHPKYKIGQVYETTIESYVIFEYAGFIWQNPKDYQKTGVLYPFHPCPAWKVAECPIKEQKRLEWEGMGVSPGGWAVYIPIGSQFEISRIYTYAVPVVDVFFPTVETRFLNGEINGRKVDLSFDISENPDYSNGLKLIR